MIRTIRASAAAIAVIALVASCSGGDDAQDTGVLPLPASAPSTTGPAEGPEMVPKALLTSTDNLEDSLGSGTGGLFGRRSGAFVSGSTVVGFAKDDVSGYDIDSGETVWKSGLDLGTNLVCSVSQPDRDVETFTVVYGEEPICDQVAILRVSDGAVLKSLTPGDFSGDLEGGVSITNLFTVEGIDHVVDSNAVVSRMTKSGYEQIAQLGNGDGFNRMVVSPEPALLLAVPNPLDPDATGSVEAYSLKSFEQVWSQDQQTLFPASTKTDEELSIGLVSGNGLWAYTQIDAATNMVQLDAEDGSIIGMAEESNEVAADDGVFSVGYGALRADATVGLPGGDVVFPQVRGMMRYSLARDEVVWSLNLEELEMDSDADLASVTADPVGITSDGKHLIAAISNTTSAEIVAIDAKTGVVDARWPVPAEFGNGFQVKPVVTTFEEGVVLGRNFSEWDVVFADYADREAPNGERYDIGVFNYPEVEEPESE